uniref:Uncharacterized protein n=1 Tax=Tetranychus urticae TaxID=32264 RepID=T1KJQ2_TETUR
MLNELIPTILYAAAAAAADDDIDNDAT